MSRDLGPQVLELARRIELRELITTGTLARRTARVSGPQPGEQVDLDIGLRVGMVREVDTFVALITLNVRARRRDGSPAFARFVHRFNIRYSGHGDASDDVLLEFVNTNGVLHAWPYARAAVQAASASLGLLPILLPVFRVQAATGASVRTSSPK